MGISLNKINEEADKRFGQFVVEDVPGGDVVLRNAMRLGKAERTRLKALLPAVQKAKDKAEDEDAMVALLEEFFNILAVGDGGKRLFAELDDDPGKMLTLIEMYAEDTQLGEALRSAN